MARWGILQSLVLYSPSGNATEQHSICTDCAMASIVFTILVNLGLGQHRKNFSTTNALLSFIHQVKHRDTLEKFVSLIFEERFLIFLAISSALCPDEFVSKYSSSSKSNDNTERRKQRQNTLPLTDYLNKSNNFYIIKYLITILKKLMDGDERERGRGREIWPNIYRAIETLCTYVNLTTTSV